MQVQTLLFSATLPSWVKDITRRFLQPGHKLVDLVGTDKMKVRGLIFLPSRGFPTYVCLLQVPIDCTPQHLPGVEAYKLKGFRTIAALGSGAWIDNLVSTASCKQHWVLYSCYI